MIQDKTDSRLIHQEISDKIISSFYKVYNTLGYGFLEKVYENSEVFYDTKKVGQYFADIIVENKIIIEVKAAECIAEEHELQLINYLKSTNIEVGLLLNFGKKPEFKRKIFINDRKNIR